MLTKLKHVSIPNTRSIQHLLPMLFVYLPLPICFKKISSSFRVFSILIRAIKVLFRMFVGEKLYIGSFDV